MMSEDNIPTINYHLRTEPIGQATLKWTVHNFSEFCHSGRSLNEDCKFSTFTANLNLSTNSGALVFKLEQAFEYDCTVVFCTSSKEELCKDGKRSLKVNDFVFTVCIEVELPKNLPNNTLVILCNLTAPRKKTFTYYLNPRKYLKWLRTSLKGHSNADLEEKVYLRIGGNTESIHKAILCVNSPVFQGEMKNVADNIVDTEDIEYPVLKNMTHVSGLKKVADNVVDTEGIEYPVLKNTTHVSGLKKVADNVVDTEDIEYPVLKNTTQILNSRMKKAVENVIDIEEIEYPVLKNMTNFLNSGTVPDYDFESVCSLYYAANKYDISKLRIACRVLLEFHLSIETVCRVLTLSDHHSDEQLKAIAIAYFQNHSTKVVATDHWQNLMRDDIALGLELIGTM